jgi:predicted Zn-dependent protease
VLVYPFKQLSPMPELAHIELAEAYEDLGEPPDANRQLDALVTKFPDGPYASYAKAVLNLKNNRKPDAAFLLQELQKQTLDPRLAERVARKLKEATQ